MVVEPSPPRSLRDRKRRRTKEAIRRAALELFSERGFDEVSVTDIAERAEVGRTTFFRYFGDKQEVLFADAGSQAAQAASGAGMQHEAIGSSLPDALAGVRSVVLRFIEHITADPEAYEVHERLVSQNPELYARSLVKQRHYADGLTDQLLAWGAEPSVARQAAEMGLACYYTGRVTAGDDPRLLHRHVAGAFDRLSGQRRS